MYRTPTRLIPALLALLAVTLPIAHPARGQPANSVPQAFLLGAWTGGLFPAPTVVSATLCLAQPTVIFTRDVVMRATFTDAYYVQRLVETARGTGTGVDFRFNATPGPGAAGLNGFTGTSSGGFGCDSPDVLHVQRISANEIKFPGCADFPFPLIRCPAG